jgi:hypothetical protein
MEQWPPWGKRGAAGDFQIFLNGAASGSGSDLCVEQHTKKLSSLKINQEQAKMAQNRLKTLLNRGWRR